MIFLIDNTLPILVCVVSGGFLFQGKYRNSLIVRVLLSASATIGMAFLLLDLKDLFTGSDDRVPRLDAGYIDSDVSYDVLHSFLYDHSGEIVYLDFDFNVGYLDDTISNNIYAKHPDNLPPHTEIEVRYGICTEKMSEFQFCDALIFENRELFYEYLDLGIPGTIAISGFFAVRPQLAPKNDINIEFDGMIAKRVLRALPIS